MSASGEVRSALAHTLSRSPPAPETCLVVGTRNPEFQNLSDFRHKLLLTFCQSAVTTEQTPRIPIRISSISTGFPGADTPTRAHAMEPVSPEARGDENHRRDDAAELLRLLSAGGTRAPSSGAKLSLIHI